MCVRATRLCLCCRQDMDDRFGVVAVVVLPDVGDGGEGRRRRWGQNGRYRLRLRRLQYFFFDIAFCLRTKDSGRGRV